MSKESGDDRDAQAEEALRLARELRQQVSNLRDQAKAVGQAIAGQPTTPDLPQEDRTIEPDEPDQIA